MGGVIAGIALSSLVFQRVFLLLSFTIPNWEGSVVFIV